MRKPTRRTRDALLSALGSCALLALSGACSSSSPTEPTGAPPTDAEVLEALFLGTGRLANTCPHPVGQWNSYPRGSAVTLRVSTSVAEADRDVLASQIAVLNDALAGYLRIAMTTTADPDPRPGPGEITSADFPFEEIQRRCGGDSSRNGCIVCNPGSYPNLSGCQLYQNPAANALPGTIHVHELGHAVGLCHIRGAELPNAVMASPNRSTSNRFTEQEVRAMRSVAGAPGLGPGATRADFVAAGLLPAG